MATELVAMGGHVKLLFWGFALRMFVPIPALRVSRDFSTQERISYGGNGNIDQAGTSGGADHHL